VYPPDPESSTHASSLFPATTSAAPSPFKSAAAAPEAESFDRAGLATHERSVTSGKHTALSMTDTASGMEAQECPVSHWIDRHSKLLQGSCS
jgi:hypothetical protein